jgi:SAM-dependent methyltransferase
MSTIFQWNEKEMDDLLLSCENDENTRLIKENLDKNGPILESGCGTGRYVRYLTDQGYDITGLEFSQDTVDMVLKKWPDLKIIQGDCAAAPFPDNHFSGIISLGVVEHFPEGLTAPLVDMYRILKPSGKAWITVPCINTVRQVKNFFWWYEIKIVIKMIAKRIIRGTPLNLKFNRLEKQYRYSTYPARGDFFEYRLTPKQFLDAIQDSGFKVLKHFPIGHIDGMYHELNPFKLLVKFNNCSFYQTSFCKFINSLLSKFPFYHAHMQGVLVTKE